MSETNETNLDETTEETTEETTGEDKVAQLEEELRKRDGSIKRLKTKLGKSKETETDEDKEETKPDEKTNNLTEKAFLRSAGIKDKDEVEFALKTAKKWDVELDELVDDDDFTEKLDKMRTKKANLDATSDVKGDKSGSSTKNEPAYWIAKGSPPTREQVPDRTTRAKIARAMMGDSKNSKKFYSD